MGKRVLVTGASGFIGANLARRVIDDGHDVHLILRPEHAAWRMRDIAARVRVHPATLEDAESTRRIVSAIRPDWVFHLAAYGAYASQTAMGRMVATNLIGCAGLLDACADAGVEAFVNAGSSSEYGHKRSPPAEDARIEPNSAYAVTKAAATHYCQLVARARGIRATTLRLYSVYGPLEEPTRLIPTLLVHALRGELPPLVSPAIARDFVYVDDAVDAMLCVARSGEIPHGAVYNVCSGRQTSLRELVALVRAMLDVAAEPAWGTMVPRAWDTDAWSGSGAAIARDLGWTPRTPLTAGLAQTVQWLRAHPERLAHYAERMALPPV